jgi:hypothetical protein
MVSHIPNREASCEPPCYSQYTSVGAASVSDIVSTTAYKRKHISTSKSLQLTKSKRPESQHSSSNSLQHRHRKISLDILPYELRLMIYRSLLPHKERIEIVPSQFLVFYHNRYYTTREPGLTGGYAAILCTNKAIYGLASEIPFVFKPLGKITGRYFQQNFRPLKNSCRLFEFDRITHCALEFRVTTQRATHAPTNSFGLGCRSVYGI